MGRPKLLDLFCKAGGASKGYHLVGFDVFGVDIEPQPNYPFKFYQADALEFPLEGYDAYHASPPCQKWSQPTAIHGYEHPDLVTPIRERLKITGRPFVIENLKRAPLINPLMLCGTMFGLRVKRHRYFECGGFDVWFAPATCACKGKAGYTASHDGQSSYRRGAKLITVAGHNFLVDEARQAMGLNWMTQRELAEAIPWVYTSYIGKFLLGALQNT